MICTRFNFLAHVRSVHESFAECSMKNFFFILLSAGDFINSIKLQESEKNFFYDALDIPYFT